MSVSQNDTQEMYSPEIERTLRQWWDKATGNVEKWGLQSIPTLLLATQEELSEVGDEMVSDLETDNPELMNLVNHLVHVGMEVQETHEAYYEDEDGNPVENPPRLELADDADLDRIEDELKDTAALLIQIQAAINIAREENDE